MNLNEAVQRLAKLQGELKQLDLKVATCREKLEATPNWIKLQQAIKAADYIRDQIKEVDHLVRDMALESYIAQGDKQPHPSVSIKVYTTIDYDPDRAKQYCIDHLPTALKLDPKVFERAAKVIELDFVTRGEEPRVAISSNLGEYL